MFPCPTCGTRDTRSVDRLITLSPHVQYSRSRKCNYCHTIFETIERTQRIIKGRRPPLGKRLQYPNDDTKYGCLSVIVKKLRVGDYIIAPNSKKVNKIRWLAYRHFGVGSIKTKKKERSKKYTCQRVS